MQVARSAKLQYSASFRTTTLAALVATLLSSASTLADVILGVVPTAVFAAIFMCGPSSLLAQEQAPPPRTYISFNVPGAGTGKNQGTMPVAIARGWIAGNVVGPHNFQQGFRRAPNGSYKLVDVPGSHYTVVMGVNLRGQVAGYFFENLLRGFLRDTDGTYIEVTPPGAEDTIVRCINGDGQVGGDAVSATEAYGFVWDRTTGFTKFGVSGDSEPGVFAINGSGVVTGSCYDANYNAHGYVRFPSGKIETFVASDDAVTTWPTAINASGQVTGYVDTPTSSRGFVRDPDGTITLFLSGTQGHAYPRGINNSGYIVGYIQQTTGPAYHSNATLPATSRSFRFHIHFCSTIHRESTKTARLSGGTRTPTFQSTAGCCGRDPEHRSPMPTLRCRLLPGAEAR